MKKHSQAEVEAFCEMQAERMRREPTKAERALWAMLEPKAKPHAMTGWKTQVPIGTWTKNGGRVDYILDFAWLDDNGIPALCIEVDGGVHKKQKGRDRRRDMRLATLGIRTIRFSNAEVLNHPERVQERVREALEELG